MAHSTYTLLPQTEINVDEKEIYLSKLQLYLSRPSKTSLTLLGVLLAASLTANILFIYVYMFRPWEIFSELPTQYGMDTCSMRTSTRLIYRAAHLRQNVPVEILATNEYASPNRTIQEAAWKSPDVSAWELVVALDEDYAIAQGLPHSQRWPWDLSKGVYILTASHDLHCLDVVRTSVNENHDGVPRSELTWHYEHVLHCLSVLLDSVKCHADDMPMYIGRLHKNKHVHKGDPRAGVGMMRTCRNWDAILQWSRARSACYRPVDYFNETFDEVERYRYCPDGSRPWEDDFQRSLAG